MQYFLCLKKHKDSPFIRYVPLLYGIVSKISQHSRVSYTNKIKILFPATFAFLTKNVYLQLKRRAGFYDVAADVVPGKNLLRHFPK